MTVGDMIKALKKYKKNTPLNGAHFVNGSINIAEIIDRNKCLQVIITSGETNRREIILRKIDITY